MLVIRFRRYNKWRASVIFGACLLMLGLGGLALQYALPARAANTMLAYWKLDETSAGATVADSSGSGHSGTPAGATGSNNLPQPSTNVPSAISFSNPRSLDFDGTDDVVTTTNPFNGDNFTIAMWVNPAVLSDGQHHGMVGHENGSGGWTYRAPGLWVGPTDNMLHYDSYDTGGTRFSGDLTNFFTSTNQWVHITWVKDGSSFRFYKNGTLFGSSQPAPATLYRGGTDYRIGGVNNYFNGLLDDIRIYDYPLTASQASQLASGDDVQPDTTAPTTPGTPAVTTPNSDTTPTWTWSASTDSGANQTGMGSPPYEVEWSQDSTFATGVSSATSSTTSFTHSSALADGTWFLRVRGVDAVGNESAWATGNASVLATQLTGGSAVNNESGTSSAITDLQVTSSLTNPAVSVKLLVSHGTLNMTTTTGLTFKNASGATISNPQTGDTLYFSGSMNDVNTALATLHYTRSSGTGSDTLEASLVEPGEVFFGDNNHLYEYVSVPGGITWTTARTTAEGRYKYGAQGYLATITSASENAFVTDRLGGAGWMGASDASSEGVWRWVTGPETNTQFCQGNNPCNSVSDGYVNWSTGEPNDSSGEDCGQFLAGGTGRWNDLPCSGGGAGTLTGYVVEYGGLNSINPTVSSRNVSITTSADATPPTTPGTPTIPTTPTTDTTPSLSWSASTDGGSGLQNPAYTIEWATSAAFTTVSGSTTTNSTSATLPTMADGTWYFRITATDNADNTATSGVSAALLIDTTAPTKPGTPATTTPSNNNMPTWDWAASTDSGSGLDDIAYAVQWSQDADFFGLGGQAGVAEDSYTIPWVITDGTWYFRVKAIDAVGNESVWSDSGVVIIDTTAPVISNIAATTNTAEQTTITWATDKQTSSQVSFGPTSSLGTTTAETNTSPRVTSHSVVLTNLIPCSIYHYTVESEDAAGNVTTSGDQTFISDGCAGSAEVVAYTTSQITTASGGSVSLDTLTVYVPAGFAGANADFQIKKIQPTQAFGAIGHPAGMLLAGTNVYDVKALQNGTTEITSFSQPITFTLHYSDADITALAEQTLAIYRWDADTGWVKLDGCAVNASANTVTCTTTHFSTFALYGQAKPTATEIGGQGSASSSKHGKIAQTNTSGGETPEPETSGSDTSSPIEANSSQPNQNENNTNTDRQATGETLFDAWWLFLLPAPLLLWWFLAARRRRKKEE